MTRVLLSHNAPCHLLLGLGVIWQPHCKTRHSWRELGNRSTVLFAAAMMVIDFDHVVRGEPQLYAKGDGRTT